MKKLITLLTGCLVALPALAQLQGYDPFSDATGSSPAGTSYTPGANLAGQINAFNAAYTGGGQATWYLRTGPGTTTAEPTISAANLTYAGLQTGGGGSAAFVPDGNSALMNLNTSTGGITPTVANTVYFSYLLNLTDITGLSTTGVGISGGAQIQFNNGNDPPSQAGVVMIRSDGGTGFNVGIDGGGKGTTPATVAWDAASYQTGNTLFIVGAYNFSDTANGFLTGDGELWINPSASTFAAASAPAYDLLSGGNNTALARIASILIDQPTGGPSGQIDELRVGLSWSDVTPAAVPEPSALALGAMGLTGLCMLRFGRKSR